MAGSLDDLLRHPLAVTVTDGGVIHRDPSLLLELTALRSDLLVTAAQASRRPILHTSASARMSPALAAALADVNGRWVVENAAGSLWDGVTGVAVDPDDPLAMAPRGTPLVRSFIEGTQPDATEVVLSASIRHREGLEPHYGALLESFTVGLGAQPAAYGPHEPLDRAWNGAELQGLLARLPAPLRLLVRSRAASPMRGSLLARATTFGMEEIVDAVVAVSSSERDLASRVQRTLERAAEKTFVLFAVVLARPGYQDLLRRPVLPAPPVPLAVLIGPPGLRDLRVDPDLIVRRFGAIRVGRPRVPNVLIPFAGEPADWTTVEELVQLLGADRLALAFGSPNLDVRGSP